MVPIDSEAASECMKTMEWVINNFDNCNLRNELIDTFADDHLPYKLNSDSVKIMSYLSPIDGVGLPYFQKYLKFPEKKNVICICLFEGVHFQSYIVKIKEFTSIHFAGINQKIQPLQKCCLKICSQPSHPYFRKESNLMLTAVVYDM